MHFKSLYTWINNEIDEARIEKRKITLTCTSETKCFVESTIMIERSDTQ